VIKDIPMGMLGAAIQPILPKTNPWQPDFRVGFMPPPRRAKRSSNANQRESLNDVPLEVCPVEIFTSPLCKHHELFDRE